MTLVAREGTRIRLLGGSIYLFFPQPDYVGPGNFLAFGDYLPKQIR